MQNENPTTENPADTNAPAATQTETPCREGFFRRLFKRIDNAMKKKAEAKSGSGCCSGDNDRSGGGCC